MVFSSIVFIFIFLPAVMILYRILPEKLRNGLLLAASLVFYAWGEPVYVLLMMFSITFNYFMGRKLEQTDRGKALIYSEKYQSDSSLLWNDLLREMVKTRK